MTSNTIANLIEEVRKNPCLYDFKNKAFNIPSLKNETWLKVAENLNESPDVVRLKWRNLRDTYVKYGNKEGFARIQQWRWGKRMRFMEQFVQRKPGRQHSWKKSIKQENVSESQEENSFQSQLETSVNEPDITIKSDDVVVDSFLNSLNRRQTAPVSDAIDLLFMSYAQTCKKFSVQSQIKIKLQLAQIFGDAELNELSSDSEDVTYSKRGSGNQGDGDPLS